MRSRRFNNILLAVVILSLLGGLYRWNEYKTMRLKSANYIGWDQTSSTYIRRQIELANEANPDAAAIVGFYFLDKNRNVGVHYLGVASGLGNKRADTKLKAEGESMLPGGNELSIEQDDLSRGSPSAK